MKLSNEPQNLGRNAWYYEQKDGLEIIHEIPSRPPEHIFIPWEMLEVSLERWRESLTNK